MNANMSMANGSGDCDGCPDADPAQKLCTLNCAGAMTYAALPDRREVILLFVRDDYWSTGRVALTDHRAPPEPPPPKPATLG